MGGSKASGAGFKPLVEPRAVGVARRRMAGLMIDDVEETKFYLLVGRVRLQLYVINPSVHFRSALLYSIRLVHSLESVFSSTLIIRCFLLLQLHTWI